VFDRRFRGVHERDVIIARVFQQRLFSGQAESPVPDKGVFHPSDCRMDVAFRYAVAGRDMRHRAVLPEVLQGRQQFVLHAQLRLPPAFPDVFGVLGRVFRVQYFHRLFERLSLHPAHAAEFAARVSLRVFVFHPYSLTLFWISEEV